MVIAQMKCLLVGCASVENAFAAPGCGVLGKPCSLKAEKVHIFPIIMVYFQFSVF